MASLALSQPAHGFNLVDGRPPHRSRRAGLVGVVVMHCALAWALLNLAGVRHHTIEATPLFVRLLQGPAAAPEPARAAPARTPRQPRLALPPPALTAPPEVALPVPDAAVQPAATATRATAAVAPAAAVPVLAAAQPRPAPPPLPPAARALPPSAVHYLVPPEPVYPSVSRRLGEAGEVWLRVEIDTEGRAREVTVHRSSGFARLDESAAAAVRATRFAPHVADGAPQVVWTIVPIVFEFQG